MALTANISNTFQIYITSNATETKTISNPGITENLAKYMYFRIIGVSAFNATGAGTLRITNGVADIVAVDVTLPGAWKDMVITQVSANVTASQNLTIITDGAGWGNNSRIILDCVATDGGSALTVS